MTNVLLEELVLAVQANDADSFKGWLYEGLQELGEPVLTGLVLNVMFLCSARLRRIGSSLGIWG